MNYVGLKVSTHALIICVYLLETRLIDHSYTEPLKHRQTGVQVYNCTKVVPLNHSTTLSTVASYMTAPANQLTEILRKLGLFAKSYSDVSLSEQLSTM